MQSFSPMNSTKVVSIGYERRSLDELTEILKAEGVEKLLDIRKSPISRKKGFSKNALLAHLSTVGIQYVHLRQAGNPYYKEKHELERCLSLYATYLEQNIALVQEIATELQGTSAVLCYERQYVDCHRSVLLEAIRKAGYAFDLIKVE